VFYRTKSFRISGLKGDFWKRKFVFVHNDNWELITSIILEDTQKLTQY
jgi:hypothetical protein